MRRNYGSKFFLSDNYCICGYPSDCLWDILYKKRVFGRIQYSCSSGRNSFLWTYNIYERNKLKRNGAAVPLFSLLKQAYKPGSVVDNHLSGLFVTKQLKPYKGKRRAALTFPKLLRMGFTPGVCYHTPV